MSTMAPSMLSPLPSAMLPSSGDLPTPPLVASGSSSPLLLSASDADNDALPTPKDARFVLTGKSSLAVQATSSFSGNATSSSGSGSSKRKNRISWATHHAGTCASSPKHRFHPYKSNEPAAAKPAQKASPLAAYLGNPTSSSPSRATTRSRYTLKPPRSILKAIRRSSINLSSTAAAAAASPGRVGRATPLSPARAPRQSSSSSQASPFQLALGQKSPRRSPYKHSPRISQSPASHALAAFGGNALFPFSPATVVRKKHASGAHTTLAEITRANGSGRRHIVSFPDLRSPANPNSKSPKLGSEASLSQQTHGNAAPTLEKAVEIAPPLPMSLLAALPSFGSPKVAFAAMINADGPSHTNTGAGSTSNGAPIASTSASGGAGAFGLGFGAGGSGAMGQGGAGGLAPAFDEQPPSSSGPSAASEEVDPRSFIVSAMRTVRFSLAGPAWSASVSENVTGGPAIPDQREADCFDSSPMDFPPRNLVDGARFQLPTGEGRRAPPPVHLRELEGAYAAIFTYAHLYITQRHLLQPSSAAQQDELDIAFAEGAEALIAALEREIHNALHPVPASAQAETNAQELAQAQATAAAAQKAVRHALLHRSGKASAQAQDDAAISSPPAFTSSSSPLPAPPAAQPVQAGEITDVPSSSPPEQPDSTPPMADQVAGKPKKLGRSTGEMRRRRGELNVAEAAVQALGALVSCERFWKAFDRTLYSERRSREALLIDSCSRAGLGAYRALQ